LNEIFQNFDRRERKDGPRCGVRTVAAAGSAGKTAVGQSTLPERPDAKVYRFFDHVLQKAGTKGFGDRFRNVF
jgi:hypothetical protein